MESEDTRDKEDTIECEIGCGTILKRDHSGICCSQGHNICPDCAPNMLADIFVTPESKIPVKCVYCNVELDSIQVERQLSQEELSIYMMHYSIKRIDPAIDKVMNCPMCNYFEVWDISSTSNFFYCQGEGCKKGSCSICFETFDVPSSFVVSEKQYKEMQKGMLKHYKCYEYQEMKKDWDKAIERGTKRFCPTCGVGGIKDDACLKMNCKCRILWCYFCGKREDKVDKKNPKGNFYQHCVDWKDNPKRCPVYLYELASVDPRWHSSNRKFNREFFHKLLTYREIRKFFKKYTKEQFQNLCDAIPSVANHGYDLEEAMTMDIELIKR
ncbi:unnamed protein product [Moneuplotes crassus]|uniref:RING-type domain-containing protein n=1 Tax=Euplotes crassus TaxID=5936 RepID=A0AAD1XKI1_EUPCR|nr:unnamed protein product [Moneuplotes crassus]